MRKLIGIISFVLLVMLVCKAGMADSFTIKLSYLEGEKSKDSWSQTSEINVSGSEITYTYSRTGRGHGENRVSNKVCTLSDEDVKKLQDYIVDKKMLVTDSLFDYEDKYKMYEEFMNADLFLSYGERIGRIRINGDVDNIASKELYIKVRALYEMLLEMVKKC